MKLYKLSGNSSTDEVGEIPLQDTSVLLELDKVILLSLAHQLLNHFHFIEVVFQDSDGILQECWA